MPSRMPLAILLSNQRRIPSQWRFDGSGCLDDGREAAVGGPEAPLPEEGFGGFTGRLGIEVLKGQADLIGAVAEVVGIWGWRNLRLVQSARAAFRRRGRSRHDNR